MQKIFETIQKYQMIEPGMRVVAGISGGADSVCLLLCLTKYRKIVPFELMAVHVEHGIRGKESLADAAFTQELCEKMGVPCRVCPVDIPQIASATGQSEEEAGRTERYRIFEEIRKEWGAQRIAVAHNQNDQAETMLWNLVRGSGLKGLGGICPVRDALIRPLLFTQRSRIEELLTEEGLSWRMDRTNLELDYTRNRIRHQILPLLEQELNSGAVRHMAQAAQHLQLLGQFLEKERNAAAERCIQENERTVVILLDPFWKEEELLRQELLRYAISLCRSSLKDIGAVHIRMLEELAQNDCGKECHLPGAVRAWREDGRLCLGRQPEKVLRKESSKASRKESQKETQNESFQLPIPGQTSAGGYRIETEILAYTPELERQIQEEKKYTKWLSCDTINSDVCLRTRQSGDYLIVNAQGGRKKLKDYFIDSKIPKEQRDRIWLLADGSHILWVIGYRISEQAKVTPATKRIMKIHLKEEMA